MKLPFGNKNQSMTSSLPTVRPASHWVLWVTLIIIIALIIWAIYAVLDESITAEATVIPLSHVQIIQNMEGGVVKQILVREGDLVEKGQVIAYIEPTRFQSDLETTNAHVETLGIKISRLTAEIDNKPFVISPDMQKEVPDMVRSEQELFASYQKQMAAMNSSHNLIQQELQMTAPLVKDGAASPVEVLHLKRQLVDIENQMAALKSHELDQLETSRTELETLKASLPAIQDRLDRTTIRSPVKGVVKQVNIATKSGVAMPGAEIMSIVPLGDTLLVEAKVKPSDIGFIHPGEAAIVRITAYDYSVYGDLKGTVDEVSADTITDPKGQTYYLVHIKTDKNYLRAKDNALYIIPGMTATVNIQTGKKTVMNYLLSPLFKAKQTALHER